MLHIIFLSQVIFILFQFHQHTLAYPKTKEKQKFLDEKLTTTYTLLASNAYVKITPKSETSSLFGRNFLLHYTT